MKNDFLYSRDSKGKVRVVIMSLKKLDDSSYVIERKSGLLDGKLITQPSKSITKGKVKRTVEEQAILEYNSMLNKKIDGGYKTNEELGINDKNGYNYTLVDSKLGALKTTSDGYGKPMLAVALEKAKKDIIANNDWYASKKLDGLRTLVHLENIDGVDTLIFKTRGGKVFKGVAENFKYDEELINIIKTYNCEIDGEFYTHGLDLKTISGVCRLDDYISERHDDINFYIFDLADHVRPVKDRVKIISDLEINNPKVKVLEHILCKSLDDMNKLHDLWVQDFYEGAMIRRADSLYGWGKRTSDLLKIKKFQDSEFEIIGIEEGLRPIEDIVFVLKTHSGDNTFKAKPLGTFADKQEYVNNINNLVGKKGTVKYQYIIKDTGIPFLPAFVAIRENGE